jgi:glycosyltransferase involved in cell wall biosynthesis
MTPGSPGAVTPRRMRYRPRLSFIAWSRSGRPRDFAYSLGGEAKSFFDFGFVEARLVPVRYLASAIRTAWYLGRARPDAVIASSPPVFPALIAWVYASLAKRPLVIDTHPASFGLKGDGLTRLMMPVQRFVSRRAAANIVTVEALAERVQAWGGTALIVHEAPPARHPAPVKPLGPAPVVLFVTIFEPDEPVELVLQAAEMLPGVQFRVTGDLRKAPACVTENAPPNVAFLGYLDNERYLSAIESAAAVISLTDRAEAVSRVGSEAVYLRRPLVISDTCAARAAFPYATRVDNTAEAIAFGVSDVLRRYAEMPVLTERAASEQIRRWDLQKTSLIEALGLTDARGGVNGHAGHAGPSNPRQLDTTQVVKK